MSPHKRLCRLRLASGLAAGTLVVAAAAPGQTPGTAAPSRPKPLEANLQAGEVVGAEQVFRERIKCGTNEFLFVVPEGLRAEALKDDRIVLTSRDARYFVTFRILDPGPAGTDPEAARRGWAARRFPNASDLVEFPVAVAGREGRGVQLQRAEPGVGERLIRVVWVPCNAGVLEFTLNTDAKQAAKGQQAFDAMLLTFRSNECGKLRIVRRSDTT